MKTRGFGTMSLIYGGGVIVFFFLPLFGFCWWITGGLEAWQWWFFLCLAAPLTLFGALVGGYLSGAVSRTFTYVSVEDFRSEMVDALYALGCKVRDASSSSNETWTRPGTGTLIFQCRLVRGIAELGPDSAEVVGPRMTINSLKLPSALYGEAIQLFEQQRFQEGLKLVEEVAKLKPKFAPAQFTLGEIYSRIVSDYKDYDERGPWAKKSVDAFREAVRLAHQYGGLDDQQLAIARDAERRERVEFLKWSGERTREALFTLPINDKEPMTKDFGWIAQRWGVSTLFNVTEGNLEDICSTLVRCFEQDIRDKTIDNFFFSIGPGDTVVSTIRIQCGEGYHFVGRFGDNMYMTVLHKRY